MAKGIQIKNVTNMWITKQDLATHLRAEVIDAISRNDEAVVAASIDSAIVEAKGYLSAYDTDAIFSTAEENRHGLLLLFVKDIAAYHLICVANINTQLELRKQRYERAVKWLTDVKNAAIAVDLPLKKDESGNLAESRVKMGSNNKRVQHF